MIIGGGPAGLTAALYVRRAGYGVTLFEGEIPGGKLNLTTDIDNYPGAPKTEGAPLALAMHTQAEESGAEIVYEKIESVTLSDADGHKTITTENGEYMCRALIIASGSENRKLGIPGEDKLSGRGVSYCATCGGGFFLDKTVAVCGGGDTALEDAQYLARMCEKVYIIHRRDKFRGSAANVERTKRLRNVEFVLESTPVEITGGVNIIDADVVEGIRVKNNKTGDITLLAVSGVFIAIGYTPVTTFLPVGTLELAHDGSIITDTEMRTSVPGVFAAGDVRNTPLRQIVTATSDGAVAAASAVKYLDENI